MDGRLKRRLWVREGDVVLVEPWEFGGGEKGDIIFKYKPIQVKILEKKGYRVELTREDDKFPTPLNSRAASAKKQGASLFVSLHCNAAISSNAKGVEIYHNGNSEDEKLASVLYNNLLNLKTKGRGVIPRDLRVLRSDIPSVLVESGFLTNPEDKKYLTDDNPDVEEAIAKGIEQYLESRN